MNRLTHQLLRRWITLCDNAVRDRPRDRPRDRGDVPGWVLITVMTAGLVTALWIVAKPALEGIFSTAVNSVKGP